MFGRHFPPQIGSWVEFDGQTFTFCLGLVEFGNFGDFALDVGEAVVGNVFDVVLDAVLLECEASSGEEDVGLAGCGEIGYAVSDEDNLYEGMSIFFCVEAAMRVRSYMHTMGIVPSSLSSLARVLYSSMDKALSWPKVVSCLQMGFH